jgi:bacterioferritin-associated ferredoxin
MKQSVTASEYVGACRYTGYVDKSIRLTLACGHEQYRKASQGIPVKARCRDCERAAAALPLEDRK